MDKLVFFETGEKKREERKESREVGSQIAVLSDHFIVSPKDSFGEDRLEIENGELKVENAIS